MMTRSITTSAESVHSARTTTSTFGNRIPGAFRRLVLYVLPHLDQDTDAKAEASEKEPMKTPTHAPSKVSLGSGTRTNTDTRDAWPAREKGQAEPCSHTGEEPLPSIRYKPAPLLPPVKEDVEASREPNSALSPTISEIGREVETQFLTAQENDVDEEQVLQSLTPAPLRIRRRGKGSFNQTSADSPLKTSIETNISGGHHALYAVWSPSRKTYELIPVDSSHQAHPALQVPYEAGGAVLAPNLGQYDVAGSSRASFGSSSDADLRHRGSVRKARESLFINPRPAPSPPLPAITAESSATSSDIPKQAGTFSRARKALTKKLSQLSLKTSSPDLVSKFNEPGAARGSVRHAREHILNGTTEDLASPNRVAKGKDLSQQAQQQDSILFASTNATTPKRKVTFDERNEEAYLRSPELLDATKAVKKKGSVSNARAGLAARIEAERNHKASHPAPPNALNTVREAADVHGATGRRVSVNMRRSPETDRPSCLRGGGGCNSRYDSVEETSGKRWPSAFAPPMRYDLCYFGGIRPL